MGLSPLLVTCAKGIPPYLKQELLDLGFPLSAEQPAGVETAGDLRDAMVLNLRLRTAHRVLAELARFRATNADELYRGVAAVAWETLVPADGRLSVTASTSTPSIRDPRYATLKCKDAIVDRIAQHAGRRPDSGPERDGTVVHLYWKDDHAVIYLDTSGLPLSRRGYRKVPHAAPLQETLAAAIVLATGWNGDGAFVNPMCGSGTLAIEAALIGFGRAPGLLRADFGFRHVRDFDAEYWKGLREQAAREARNRIKGRIIATDRDPAAVAAARKNAAAAGVGDLIEFGVCDFTETTLPGGGVIAFNPEYGVRMGETASLEGVYKGIGDFLKQKCRGARGYVFTGSPALAKKIGLKPARRIPFQNSGIACTLLEYELYEGSRRTRKPRPAAS